MLKRTMINLGTRKYLKRNESQRHTVPFPRAKKIGVIFNKSKTADINEINSFISRLEMQGKEVSVLCYNTGKTESNNQIKNFSLKDIKWNGKLKSFGLKKFIRTEFDYLFSLNSSPILPVENIIARSKAKCRIGIFHQARNHYEMMISPRSSKDKEGLLNEMMQYTQMIKR